MTELEKSLKLKRRGAKARFTRLGNALDFLVNEERSVDDISKAESDYEEAYKDLQVKHEALTDTIEDDSVFEEEEKYMDECQKVFLRLQVKVKDYLENLAAASDGQPVGMQDVRDASPMTDSSQAHGTRVGTEPSCFKMERPKLPKFTGDLREYHSFKADFQHVVHRQYGGRDALMILKSCLSGKPLQNIQGLGQDYDAAWKQLDLLYGDPRMIADVIVNDLSKIKGLKNGEDERFVNFVNLVRRSYNSLNEIGRGSDMNNSHMLALIERKMCVEDRRLWFRSQQGNTSPTLEVLLQFLEVEMKARLRSSAPVRSDARFNGAVNQISTTVASPKRTENRCWVCKSDGHWTDQCTRFTSKSLDERMQMVKDNYACFSCLKKASKDHRISTCKRKKRCTETVDGVQCSYFHHPLLHSGKKPERKEGNVTKQVGITAVDDDEALLPVLTVDVIGNRRAASTNQGNLLLDSGSQTSLIREAFAEKLMLKGVPITLTMIKVGGTEEVFHTKRYLVPLRECGKSSRPIVISAMSIPCISENIAAVDNEALARRFHLKNDELKRGSGSVDVLVGIDNAKLHGGEVREDGYLAARRSPLGWVVFGVKPTDKPKDSKVFHIKMISNPVDLTDFWSSETMGVIPTSCHCMPSGLSRQEEIEEQTIRSSCKKVGNQWQVSYPWKKDPNLLPDNRSQAEKILVTTEKRLARNEVYAAAYNEQMNEMENLGFSRKLADSEIDSYQGPVHYISHHAVLRPEKKSTPVRIVFNSSASFQGHTLNEYWMKGPDLLNSLLGVLLRFRERKVAVCGDISKMYHRVLVPESDQHVHRFLWRNMQITRSPDTYIKTVLTFGDKPAPAMAQIALRKTAEEAESRHPEAAQVLKTCVYMDDICESVTDNPEAERLTKEIDQVLAEGGFKVKGWLSNQPLTGNTQEDKEMRLLETMTEEKVLGAVWENSSDMFSYKVKMDRDETDEDVSLNKRQILSQIARVFDPLGFVSPFLVRAKIGMQKLWEKGYEWDEKLPEEDQKWWIAFFKEMKELSEVRIARSLTPATAVNNPILCVFADASQDAFGSCIYLRWQLEGGTYEVRFVVAKSRVAPLKKLTMPRLELQAAVLATRLYTTVKKELRLEIEKVVFMTDSQIVLSWVRSQRKRYKPFIAVRVAEVQSQSDPAQWRYVPGSCNPADDVSRGLPTAKLGNRWLKGPDFLYTPECEWPTGDGEAVLDDEAVLEVENRKVFLVSMATNQEVINCENFSSWRRLVRVAAYILRFVHKLKDALNADKKDDDNQCLTPEEIQEGENMLIRGAQTTLKARLDKGEFKTLSPYTDEKGIIRVGGRTDRSLLSFDMRHPVLLPREDKISWLITSEMHQEGHSGVAATTGKVRKRYWILQGHKLAKMIKFRCTKCRQMEHAVEKQLMAELPQQRVAPQTPPFYNTSVDYFGPYRVKITRNTTAKYYGVIFTCLNTRAVHLEMATDCSTMAFLLVIRRFFAIRGQPAYLLSDNGTQFVGADRELREVIRGWDAQKLAEFCASKRTEWKFTTPSAPHQNGCAESLVKSCKYALKKAIGEQLLTPFELYTCLLDIANLINQRPIGRIPNDPDDGSYICPNDMLLGRASRDVPQGPFRDSQNPRHRVEFVQQIVDSFWKRWTRDVLPLLVPRRKWNADRRNVRVDDIVMLADANEVRGKWLLGRVVEVYPGLDDRVRNVKVRTASGEYRRPITKIAVICPAEGYTDE
ncbi:uncharacterized protein LOC121414350 [Lytechinus variegatus]|uniref:uncharacterized protein LOC121414350 n=1 Tax=Lytechinus variegatus TaxID=7654 RepID=UPI001BB0E2DA|nr:uncharacterized protein LOC121414350 [Lytechinus variegatus]